MPFRISCPACSATLNLKDELAGRAVKCPRCGDIVPATATQPPTPAAAFEVVEDDAPPAPPPPAAKPKAAPAAKPQPAATLDEDDEDDPRPKRRGKPAGSKRNKLIVLGMVGYWVFAVAGSLWLNYRGTNRLNLSSGGGSSDRQDAGPITGRQSSTATKANFDKLNLKMTRAEVEQILGPGEQASQEQVKRGVRTGDWVEKAGQGRVLSWTTGKDQLFALFYPDGGSAAQLQAKGFQAGTGGSYVGSTDDEHYARSNGLPHISKPRDDPKRAEYNIAGRVATAYAQDATTAGYKYDNMWMNLNGVLRDLKPDGRGGAVVTLEGTAGEKGPTFRCAVNSDGVPSALGCVIGATVEVHGKCVGLRDGVISLTDCRSVKPGINADRREVAAGNLLSTYLNPKNADPKYKDAWHKVDRATVESRDADGSLLIGRPTTGKRQTSIKVVFDAGWKDRAEKIKPGDIVSFVGLCTGSTDGVIQFEKAWPVPSK